MVHKAVDKAQRIIKGNRERFLRKLTGVIHIGANIGQEKDLCFKYNLNVMWIEPIPKVFNVLKNNIKGYPRQNALKYLITDKDNEYYKFHIANNFGASSSILKLHEHKELWPGVTFEEIILLKSITLTTLCRKENINMDWYDGLILDTQGSELMVLKGAIPLLHIFKYIKVEVPDFESYKGCCKTDELGKFLIDYNFKEVSRYKFACKKKVGSYYDIIYKQKI